ncbi:transcriptional regulator [Clostridium scatologenes]|uniref:DNA-binding protein n=1 Tax=Clostridium scatologenes TaxID=1548 RepID=A0A0E3MA37_CLOSL|nr:transcriptional regulator [Clostridium scatologenes]AKA70169.1 DNA-binding protein [Clostridium scatologenes]
MIGLEYALGVYGIQHSELAARLGIQRQNINQWIKCKSKIPKKYFPVLSDMFGISIEYLQKELDDIDKLVIQKEKLMKELKPEIVKYDMDYNFEERDVVQVPIYSIDKEIKSLDKEIKKIKIIDEFKNIINSSKEDYELDKFILLLKLFKSEKVNKHIVEDTIEAICHYYDIVPEWVLISSSEDLHGAKDYMDDIAEVIKKYYK